MKKLLLFFLLSMQIFAQNDSLKSRFHNSFLYFLPNSNNLVSIIVKEKHHLKNIERENTIVILSKVDGRIIKQITLSDTSAKIIHAFTLSHDGLSFVVLSSSIPDYEGPFIIRKYSLEQDHWVWEKEWYGDNPYFRVTFSEDNKQIIGVSAQNTFIIDAETGSLIRKSNLISSVGEYSYVPYNDLSPNGRYFAFWWNKYLRWSSDDESGILRLLDLSWYGIKWLFHLGNIPNYLYVWDVYKDTLYCKFKIPYGADGGIPVFTEDELNILIENFDFEYQVYSLSDKKLTRDFNQVDSGYPKKTKYAGRNCKIISPNTKLFAETYSDSILVIDYGSGKLICKYNQTSVSYNPIYSYAMAFSSESKYFAVVTSSHTDTVKTSQYNYTIERGNKLILFETQSWKKVWEKDLSKEE